MHYFQYKDNILFVEDVPLPQIAEQFGTPCYVYSRATLETTWHRFNNAFGKIPHKICYAVKANSNIGILNLFARLGSGFDIVSVGELERVLAAGGDPKKIIFSGVGKQTHEIMRALEVGVFCLNIESINELERLNAITNKHKKTTNIALRVNPNIDARTHPYISTGLHENKFGIEIKDVLPLFQKIKTMPSLKLIGIGCHIGSQLLELSPFQEAIDSLLNLLQQLKSEGAEIQHLDIGGGLGIRYQNEEPPTIEEYVFALCKKLAALPLEIILEPGRSITANAGILLTKVGYLKHSNKNFAIVDAAMNDLMRPALYSAWHDIISVTQRRDSPEKMYDVVGPICESADFLGKNRSLALQENDLLAICSAGAYGFVSSSNYNTRPRAAEVLVDKDKAHLIRERETIQELFAKEKLI